MEKPILMNMNMNIQSQRSTNANERARWTQGCDQRAGGPMARSGWSAHAYNKLGTKVLLNILLVIYCTVEISSLLL